MEWFYEGSKGQAGPIGEEKFHSLVQDGKITARTLVWNSTMADWQKYGRVVGDTSTGLPEPVGIPGRGGGLFCSECRREFAQDEMLRFENLWVCAECKPVFVQKLKEGVSLSGEIEYGGFWIRFGAKFIDWMVIGVVNMVIIFVAGIIMAAMIQSPDSALSIIMTVTLQLLQLAITATYTTWLVGRYGATLGKMACQLKVITADGGRVSYPRALGRSFAEILSSIILLIGYIMAAFDDEKRTLHDRICNTRVIKK